MALDWFSGLIGYDASALRMGRVLNIGPDGEVLWEKDSWEKAEGSYSASVQVARDSATSDMMQSGYLCSPVALRVSGNPTKFLQGHNVFGPSVENVGPVLQAMARKFPDGLLSPATLWNQLPAVHRTRYDVAVHVDLGGDAIVADWLRAAGSNTRSRHGRALVSGETVYWGKNSRRWSLKAYNKFRELKEHPPAVGKDELMAWCEGHLRIELTLRRPELKDRDALSEDVVWEFYEKVTIGGPEMVTRTGTLPELDASAACRTTLQIWAEGGDPALSISRSGFYKFRRQILDQVGVDISIPRAEQWESMNEAGFDVEFLKSRQVALPKTSALQKLLFKVA